MNSIDPQKLRTLEEFIATNQPPLKTRGASRLTVETHDGVLICGFVDRNILDEANIQQIGNELRDLVDGQPRRPLIIDFTNVDHLSSAALGTLISLNNRSMIHGVPVVFAVEPGIDEVFVITKLDRLFVIVERPSIAVDLLRPLIRDITPSSPPSRFYYEAWRALAAPLHTEVAHTNPRFRALWQLRDDFWRAATIEITGKHKSLPWRRHNSEPPRPLDAVAETLRAIVGSPSVLLSQAEVSQVLRTAEVVAAASSKFGANPMPNSHDHLDQAVTTNLHSSANAP